MIQIAYIIDTIFTPSAGTEKQLLYLLHGIDRGKYTPHLICFYPSEWMKSQSFPFPVHYVNLNSFLSLDFFKAIGKFKQLHKENNFSIAQTFFKDGNMFGTYAAHKAKIPIIISSRRNVGYWHDKKQIAILRFLSRWTNYYLANSNAAAQMTIDIEQAKPEQLNTIYNGLPLQKFSNIDPSVREHQRSQWGIKPGEIVVGSVANLRPVKRVDRLIEAATSLCQRYDKLRFIAVGEGDERPRLQQIIDENNITDTFQLVGRMEEPVSALAGFDIAVLPSSNESFSNALVEYMAMGLPIVAGDVGGNSEAITHKVTGLLYDPTHPGAIAQAITELLEQPLLSQSLGQKARETAFEKYSIDSMVKNHELYYDSIIKRKP